MEWNYQAAQSVGHYIMQVMHFVSTILHPSKVESRERKGVWVVGVVVGVSLSLSLLTNILISNDP